MKKLLLLLLFAVSGIGIVQAQLLQMIGNDLHVSGFTAITLESKCTGTGSGAAILACGAWDVTPSAGDLYMVFCYTNNGSFDPSNITVNDPVNGNYPMVMQLVHPANADDRAAVAFKENASGGTTVPQCQNWEANGMGIAAYAWKSTRTTFALDGAAGIFLSKNGTTSTTPNAGTAASASTNAVVVCQLVTTSAQTTTAGASYTPSGTLTGVTNTLAQYLEYQINPGGTVNCNYTLGTTKTYTDNQVSALNASSAAGYEPVGGMIGVPAAAQTNGASATVAILNTNSGSLMPFAGDTAGSPWSLLAGSAVTFDTSVAPLGTLNLMGNGVKYTLGAAGASFKVPSANTTTAYQLQIKGIIDNGSGDWLGSFYRLGTNAVSGTICDTWNLNNTIVEGNLTTQVAYDTGTGIHFQAELAQGNIPTITDLFPSPNLNRAQDYFIITKAAGINDANSEWWVLSEATPGTLPWIVHDHFTRPRGGQVVVTTTATASSGASSITVTSATSVARGQSIYSATGSVDTGQITRGTVVCDSYSSGTSIPLCNINTGSSAVTNASMSATPVEFTGPVAGTQASVTAGSTALTVVSGTGLVAGDAHVGQYVAMAGVAPGTWLLSGSGTAWTMSQKAVTTQSTVQAKFWTPSVGSPLGIHFGKYSSCNSAGDAWFSGFIWEPIGPGILSLVTSGGASL